MKLVEVKLGGPTPYDDYPPIPVRLARNFNLWVLTEGGGMRLADRVQDEGEPDIVSEAIAEYGVWEVPETIVLSSAFAASPQALFVDLGCHVGWFSALAGSWGLDVWAVDSNPTALAALTATWERNHFGSLLGTTQRVIDADTAWSHPERDQVIIKIDIEGAESHAVGSLWPWFEDGTITHCLMEVSPCFNDGYPALLRALFDVGYQGRVMPTKMVEPRPVDDVARYLSHWCRRLDRMPLLTEWVGRQHQFNCVVFRPDAAWG